MTNTDIVSVTVNLHNDAITRFHAPSLDWEWELSRKYWGDRSAETILAACFREGNVGERGGARCRSMSVGDTVTITVISPEPTSNGMLKTERHHYRCENCGWGKLTEAALHVVRDLPSRDVSFDLESLVEWGSFPKAMLSEVVKVA